MVESDTNCLECEIGVGRTGPEFSVAYYNLLEGRTGRYPAAFNVKVFNLLE